MDLASDFGRRWHGSGRPPTHGSGFRSRRPVRNPVRSRGSLDRRIRRSAATGGIPMSLPSSTYRLQLHGGFPFKAAEERIAYFSRLGIGAAYLSPILLARPGSPHGYDICDHNRINPELGGESGFRELAESLRGAGLGCLVDYVPNHMGADPASNPWWWDVLENGPSSPYGRFYDIDWEPIKPDLKGKVLLPVLGDQYGRILERGEMRLRLEEGGLVLGYYEHTFPINPRMAPLVLAPDGDSGGLPFGEESPEGMEYLSILTSLRNMPA